MLIMNVFTLFYILYYIGRIQIEIINTYFHREFLHILNLIFLHNNIEVNYNILEKKEYWKSIFFF